MPWVDHPNIKAIVWPGLPGQESGNALADVLYGDVNPSARLPYTIARYEKDYPASIDTALNVNNDTNEYINAPDYYSYIFYRSHTMKE